jgi:hypothetical protein
MRSIMITVSIRVVALVLALHCAEVRAADMTCPLASKVALTARVPGWLDNTYGAAYGPLLTFEGMRLEPTMVECRYQVERGRLVSVRKYVSCATGKGDWREQGGAHLCQAAAPEMCVIECSEPPASK